MEKAEQQWEQEEAEEEEEEVAVALRGRRPRHGDSDTTTPTTAAAVSNDNINGNGDTMPSSESAKGTGSLTQEQEFQQEELQYTSNKDINVTVIEVLKGIEEVDWQKRSEKSVYHDQDEGAKSTHGFSGMEFSSIQCSASKKNPGDDGLDVTVKNLDTWNSLSTVINHQYTENLKDNSLSGFSHLPSEKSFEEHDTEYKSFNNKTIERADTNLIKESHQEVTELDVERVLEKQDTHDLYCPNCNSCITRRVVLRKRKHKIRNSSEDAKRNKLETVVQSELDAISAHAANDQGHDTVDICLDGSPTPAANDYNRDREPEIFRCLSCFSFFIPTGNGFKLFRIFGDKSEKKNMQDPQQIPAMNKNWFSSIFSSDKGETSLEQGSDRRVDMEKNNAGALIPSFNLKDQHSQASSVEEGPSPAQSFGVGGLVKSNTTEPQKGGDDVVSSSTRGPVLLGKVMVDLGEKFDDAMEKDTVSVLGESDTDDKANILPDISYENKQHVGAALLTGSVIENGSANGKIIDKDGAYPSEVSQHSIIGTKVAIHKEEPLKVDRDALIPSVQDALLLQDKRVNLGKDLKDMPAESNEGTETIITVEEGPVELAASQRAQSIIASVETGTSPHTETQIYVGDQKGIEARGVHGMDIMKSIVYGGLVESITSLGVVSSAAGADAATLNVLALGLANLIGGLFFIGHNLWELKNDHSGVASNQITEQVDRYQELLGRRENFLLHATVAVLSFLIFGLVPPVIYGFSFRESDNKDFKLVAVAAASLICIIILAIGKTYVQRPPKSYIKTVVYYVIMWFMVSGVSYVVGILIKKLLEKLGWFQSSSVVTLPLLEKTPMEPAWESY